MKNVILSYIIPIYNTAAYLPQCLDSLYSQDIADDDFEVILVNDGSTDESGSVCKQYMAKHANIKYFYQANQGQGAARNRGIDEACGKYIMFVDSDDYLIKQTVKPILKKADEYRAELLLHEVVEERKDGSIVYAGNQEFADKLYTGLELLLRVMQNSSVWTTLFSTDFLKSHRFHFAVGIKHEDALFNYAIYPYAKRVLKTNEHVYFYRYNANSTDRSTDYNKRLILAKSDLYIAYSLKAMSLERIMPEILKRLYLRTSNSLLVSSFLQMMRGITPFRSKKDFFKEANRFDLFPIYGRTRSWKTSWVIPIANFLAAHYLRK